MSAASSSARVFFCHAQEDEELRVRLEAHLTVLQRSGLITIWNDDQLLPGQDWSEVVHRELRRADVILLLVSASFLGCDYCYDAEMSRAIERHERGEAVIIPVLLRPVDWEGAPFGELPCLPGNRLAVTMWRDADEAFVDVERGIRRALEARSKGVPFAAADPPAPAAAPVQARTLDAAVAPSVVVGEPAEVLAMIATASSGGLRALLRLDPQAFQVTPDDVRSSGFELDFPLDSRGQPRARTVVVALESPDFEPALARKKILVPPGADSTVSTFLVRPRRAGPLWLQMEVQLDDTTVWSQRLRTSGAEAGAPLSGGYVVTSIPLSTTGHAPGVDPGRMAPPLPPPPGMVAPPNMGPPPWAAPTGAPSPGAGMAPRPGGGMAPPPPAVAQGAPHRGMIPPDWLRGLDIPSPPPIPAPPAGGGRSALPMFAPPPQNAGGKPPAPPGLLSGGSRGPQPPHGCSKPVASPHPVHPKRALAGFLVSPSGLFWPLLLGQSTVGREGSGVEVDIPLPHATISTHHALLEHDGHTLSLFNTGGRHGSFVNEEQVLPGQRHLVRDRDWIRFGAYTLLVVLLQRPA